MVSIALYQPEIPQNVGAAMRLCACMGTALHIIEPTGFVWNKKRIKDSAMDYFDRLELIRHASWEAFLAAVAGRRIILMSTKASQPYASFSFQEDDILLAGRESAGVPEAVHEASDARVLVPMKDGLRSLNIVNATSMILGEALRQTQWTT